MCVISGVYDYYRPRFERYEPLVPEPFFPGRYEPRYTLDELSKLIADFKAARDAAKVVDELTGQPDCVDPDKAKLEQRVAALEKILRDRGLL